MLLYNSWALRYFMNVCRKQRAFSLDANIVSTVTVAALCEFAQEA